MFPKVIKNQSGEIFAEYSLLATLIAVACVIAVSVFGGSALKLFEPAAKAIQ